MTREEKFADLRKILNDGISKLEAQGASMAEVGAQIAKAGVAISLAAGGAAETLQGVMAMFEQLSTVFPEQGATAEIDRRFPAVKGRA